MSDLTPRQKQFTVEYVIDLNAKAAAERAGYSKRMSKQIGWELLRKPHVAAAIAAEMAAREKRTRVSADRVLEQLARLAYFDPRKMFEADGSLKPIASMDDDEAAALAGFEAVELVDGSVVRKVRLADRGAALEKLARHLGMFRDRVELSGPNGDAIRLLVAQVQNRSTIAPVETLPAAGADDEATR
jgi:phage terminase small subunit